MGNKLFGVDISGIVNKEIGPGVLAATLTKVTEGTPTPGALTQGTNPTTADHACRGFIDTQRVRFSNGTLVRSGSKVVILIGDSIDGGNTAPALNDRITIEGTEYFIPEDGTIGRDPAAATYECEVRAR